MNKSILGIAHNMVSEIYEACNKFQWFTCGTNEQYEELFKFIRTNAVLIGTEITFKGFCQEISERIAEHSKQDHDVESIMFCVVQAIAPHYFQYEV